MPIAFDFNEVPGPSADEIKSENGEGALTYGTGAQQAHAYIAGLEAAGLHTVEIWEHNVDSILGGFAYGVSECQAWEASHDPGLVYLACDLNDGALGGRDPLPFCSGWSSVTREPAFGVYGPDQFLLPAMASGIPKLSRFWGVVNWIAGGAPDNAQSNIDFWTAHGAHLVQLIGSPLANTDQNLILKPDWWSTGGAPKPTPKPQETDMEIVLYARQDGHAGNVARLLDGGIKLNEWVGDGTSGPGPGQEYLGVPNGVSLWGPKGTVSSSALTDVPTAKRFVQLTDAFTALLASGPAAPAAPVDVKALAAALAPLLTGPGASLTEAQVEDAIRVVLHGA